MPNIPKLPKAPKIPKVPKMPQKPAPNSKSSRAFIYFLICLFIVAAIYAFMGDNQKIEDVPVSKVVQEIKDGQVKSIDEQNGK